MFKFFSTSLIFISSFLMHAQTDIFVIKEGEPISGYQEQEASKKYQLQMGEIKGLSNELPAIDLGIPVIDGFKKKEYGFMSQNDVQNPSWEIKQKFTKENNKNASRFSRDYYLGDIKTKSKYIKISCRDHEYEDGDRIKLLLNSKVILPEIKLRNRGFSVDVMLKDGFNTIEFYALNQGSSGPNTAELKVYDDKGNTIGSGQWNLSTGYKAKLIVLKEADLSID